MRFFDRRWASGVYGTTRSTQIEERYRQRLGELRDEVLRRFTDEVSLHDALIDCAEIAEEGIRLSLIAGSADSGFKQVMLAYEAGNLSMPSLSRFHRIINDRRTRVLYSEFDEDELGMTHSLLLWPDQYRELSIRFRRLSYSTSDLPEYGFRSYGTVLVGNDLV
jgi:hypothetical protein